MRSTPCRWRKAAAAGGDVGRVIVERGNRKARRAEHQGGEEGTQARTHVDPGRPPSWIRVLLPIPSSPPASNRLVTNPPKAAGRPFTSCTNPCTNRCPAKPCLADVLLALGSVNGKVQDVESSGAERHNPSCFGPRKARSAANATRAGDAGADDRSGQARNPASLRNLRVALSRCVTIPTHWGIRDEPGSRGTCERAGAGCGPRRLRRRPAGR